MVQMAWTFINDSFQTTLCLQWEPEIIAIAAIYLASKLGQFEISDWQGTFALYFRASTESPNKADFADFIARPKTRLRTQELALN